VVVGGRLGRFVAGVLAVSAATASACGATAPSVDPLDAVLRLEVDSCESLRRERATAAMIGPDLAATVAHPFLDDDARPESAEVTAFGTDGRSVDVRVVFLDAASDVALLGVGDGAGAPLLLGDWEPDAVTSLVGFVDVDAAPTERPMVVVGRVDATLDGIGPRTVLELEGSIRPGDSGAPVVDADHRVVGIVFAARDGGGGWAIDASEFRDTEPGTEIEFTCD
jgi:hypothetical protein